MAAIVSRGNGHLPSSVSIQEKGIRSKRKFHSDTPLGDADTLPLSQPECMGHELEKCQDGLVHDQHAVSDLCGFDQKQPGLKSNHVLSSNRACEQQREVETECTVANWSDITETQLEELVLSTLDIIYKNAIREIVAHGYGEDVVIKAVLRSGLYYGCKDIVSNIVDNALLFLRTGQDSDSSKERIFKDLEELEKYILAEMVCVLREVRSSFSLGDAMWCLLICDMNMSHACAIDGDLLGSLGCDEPTGSSSVSLGKSETNRLTTIGAEFSTPRTSKPNKQNSMGPELPAVAGIPNLPSARFSGLGMMSNPDKEHSFSSTDLMEGSSSFNEEPVPAMAQLTASRISVTDGKMGSGRKGHLNSSKRDSILHQKSIPLEKNYRVYGSKGALKSGKLSGFTSLFMDKKCRPMSEAAMSNFKNSIKISKGVGVGAPQMDVNFNLSVNVASAAVPGFTTKAVSKPSALPAALSLNSTNDGFSVPGRNLHSAVSCAEIGQWAFHDKDEVVLKLLPQIQALQCEMQQWTEWAQQKVMQAARRLGKDKAELKALRQEKEDVARLKKEKQTLEESTMKKLLEMENALCKASGQVDRANAAVQRLEVENSQLRKVMEAAKLQAAQSAAKCQEVSKREKKTLKKYESWDRQKTLLQEELVTQRRRFSQLQRQLEQAKDLHNLFEARQKQEEKLKEEAQTQANSERKEREKILSSAKSKEDAIRSESEIDFQRYRSDISRLEIEIAQLKLKTDPSKLTPLRLGVDGFYTSSLKDAARNHSLKVTKMHWLAEMMDFQDLGLCDVQRERECVMCLTDEISVVFLPCAHQVVCGKCNELHEKQGMEDCPSCRTPIQQRVIVRFADS